MTPDPLFDLGTLTLAPDNPLAGQAVFELMSRINAASHYADLLLAVAKEDGE